jgi:hypothetical protein
MTIVEAKRGDEIEFQIYYHLHDCKYKFQILFQIQGNDLGAKSSGFNFLA